MPPESWFRQFSASVGKSTLAVQHNPGTPVTLAHAISNAGPTAYWETKSEASITTSQPDYSSPRR
jgi:hypothetical protein